MNRREAEYLALLVHKGFLPEAAARAAMAERQPDESLPACLARRGLLAIDEAERLFANQVGTEPMLTRYEILERLGEGATAYVFAARDRQSSEVVALKVLREEVARVPAKLERFVAEGQLLCRLRHPGIVAGRRVAKDQGTVFLAMERIAGETLEDRLLREETFDEIAALRIVHQVAGVLAHLKSQQLVHRDLKPGNLMLTGEGRVVLIDLGFAVRSGQSTASATTVGTVEYIAPEQARGEANLDSRADIYSLGATLYHLVVGEPPFSGEARADVLHQQVFTEISSEKIKALGLSPRLHYFIEKMMAKDRDVRYQEPAEIVADFEEKLGAALTPPAPPATDRPRPRRRRLSRRRR